VTVFFFTGSTPGRELNWRLGKISPETSFDHNRVARSKRTKFIALPFYRNPAVAAASKGLGGYPPSDMAGAWAFGLRWSIA
jgi:hypothetical protein